MALFGKKKTGECCAICGKERKTGLFRGLFQIEVEGQYVCGDCYNIVDAQQEICSNMTMEQFRAHLAFREENCKLKEIFAVTSTIDFGGWGNKILFDYSNGFMSLDANLEKTIFRSGELRSFTIREDDNVIFEGSAEGLNYYRSDVVNIVHLLEPNIRAFHRERHLFESKLACMSGSEREREANNAPWFSVSEPFHSFHVDLYFDHPYWKEKRLDMQGPCFDSRNPDAGVYLSSYRSSFNLMECLANELMTFGFSGTGSADAVSAAAISQSDVADALLRFKELLDMGAITEEEFAAKKKQLLNL